MTKGPGQWDVHSEQGLLAYYEAAFDAAYHCAIRLTAGNHADAEELVQDAFVRLMRSARSGGATDVGVGWIITTTRRLFVDRARSRQREDRRLRLVATPDVVRNSIPVLRRPEFLAALSDRERAALIFRYVDDLAVTDVADLLNISVRATESLLQRAKRKARKADSA